VFICVGWQVTLRDPIWQASYEMEYHYTTFLPFLLTYLHYVVVHTLVVLVVQRFGVGLVIERSLLRLLARTL